jgi:tetratricopeptide (TPR) repeat protein
MRSFRKLGAIGLLKEEHRWVALLNGQQSSFAANSLVRIAKVHELLNQSDDALATYQTIESSFPHFANRGRGGIMLRRAMGRIFMGLERFPEALDTFETALQLTKLQPTHAIFIQADLNAIAVVHEKMGNLSDALAKRQEAWKELDDIGCTQVVTAAVCLTRMASTYESMQQRELALEKLEMALAIYILNEGEFPRSATVARLHNRIGNLLVTMGRSGTEHFRQAIEVYRRGGMSDEHTALASLLRKIGAEDNV